MKKILGLIIFILIKISLLGQLYQYTSHRVVITNINTSETNTSHKIGSFTVDSANKKIIIGDSASIMVYKIVSTKLTKYDASGTERHEYKCLDKKGAIQIINLVLFNEIIQKELHVSGQLEITIGAFSYAYDLHKKT
jgi:hypothetical protein